MKRSFSSMVALLSCLGPAVGCAIEVTDEEVARQEQSIVRGRPVSSAETWGTVGFLLSYDGRYWVCSGTLIAPDLIVTAAHCLQDELTGSPPETLDVIAGAFDIDAATAEQTYVVDRVVAHPDVRLYGATSSDPTGLGARHDIALVRTTEPITQVSVVPILPKEELDNVMLSGAKLTIAGYGRRYVDAFGASSEDGLHYVGELSFARRTDYEFLAGGSSEADTCPGDSGGPVYVNYAGKVWVVGATSRGRDDFPNIDCGEGGIYTLVSAYTDWIEQTAADPNLSNDSWAPVGNDENLERQPLCSAAPTTRPASALLGAGFLALSALAFRRTRRRTARARAL